MKVHNANSVTNSNANAVIPIHIQERLNGTYASLKNIPQEEKSSEAKHRMRFKRKTVALIAAAACLTFGGAAFAATNLLQIGTGQTNYFDAQKNLPVFNSMQEGAAKYTTEVGQSATIKDLAPSTGETTVTLDEITCDRNVANLYFTLTRQNGFNLEEASTYSGSKESEWVKVQQFIPNLAYTLRNNNGEIFAGSVIGLDAYMQDDNIKALMRITPEKTMTPEVQIDIYNLTDNLGLMDEKYDNLNSVFNFGLDLNNVKEPREVNAGVIEFTNLSEGIRKLNIKRFTTSELGTVLACEAIDGEDVYGPSMFEFTDNLGNTLFPVRGFTDGERRAFGAQILELAGMSVDAESVTITPIEYNGEEILRDKGNDVSLDNDYMFDVTQNDIDIPTSEISGWKLKEWKVENNTVTLRLSPYGWHGDGNFPFINPVKDVSTLKQELTDPVTGEKMIGEHSGAVFTKYDYVTGDVLLITSYYAASDEELKNNKQYKAYRSIDGVYTRNNDAARTISFK